MKRFEGKTVLITGASGGLGSVQCKKFAEQGANLAINYVNIGNLAEEAQKLADELTAAYGGEHRIYAADVSKEEDVVAMVEAIKNDFGQIDVLVNNAGISINASTWKYPKESWEKVIGINLTGAFNCTKAVLPLMRERVYGRIINLSSVVGVTGAMGTVAYGTSKAGLIGMMKTVAREVAAKNITINCVAPGYINAGIIRDVPDRFMEDNVVPSIPMKRLGEAEDIANAIAFLASDEARYITGIVLPVDGGFAM